MKRLSACRLLTLLVLAVVKNASADSTSAELAAEHFQLGLNHARASEIDAAATEFEAAYQASPNFAVLYNLGRTYMAMGRAVDAVDAFTRYLAEGGSTIESKRRAEVAASIALNEKRIGQLEIEVEPALSAVQIDGKAVPVGEHAVRLLVGEHALLVSAPGYRSYAQALTISHQAATPVRVHLLKGPAAPNNAWLSISCSVPSVTVLVDNSARGETPLRAPLGMTAEPHHVIFRRAGYVDSAFDWSPLSASALDCDMTPAAILGADAATLVITESEPGAQVLVDSKRWNRGALPFGRHHLELKRFGFQPFGMDVELKRGQTKRLKVALSPERDYAKEHLSNIRAQHIAGYALIGTGSALAITAGTLAVLSSRAFNDWRRASDVLGQTPSTAPNYQQRQQDVARQSMRVQSFDDWTLSSAIAGGALLVSGVTLLLTADAAKRYELPTARITADGASLGWRQTF